MKTKGSGNTYIIYALICLIVFNIGAMLIRLTTEGAEPVFSGNEPYFKDESIFIPLISRTSSMMSLHKKQYYIRDRYKSAYRGTSIVDRLKEFLKAQFPSILFAKMESTAHIQEDERDIESYPLELEDFIIIDRLEEYEDLIIIKDSEGNIDVSEIIQSLNIKSLGIEKERPYILIYHTHGTESYSSLENNRHHIENEDYNVIGIGKIIASVLSDNGHGVEHVSKYHDIPSYNKSYTESLRTVNEKVKENENLKVLLDIHRDGHDHNDPKVIKNLKNLIEKSIVEVNGKKAATFYFVIGPDSPNSEEVLNFAKYIKMIADALYPNLCTGIMIKPIGRYNQFISDYSALIELGSNLNTIEEAKETARLLGEILTIAVDAIDK